MKIVDVPKSILDLLAMAKAEGDESWGAPEIVKATLRPVPPFEPAMLPDALRAWVVDIAHRMQCPIDFVATAGIAMLGSVVGSACGIRPKQKDDWTEVPNLWGAAIGDPGRLKTPAISQAMAPLHALDYDARAAHSSALMVHQQEKLGRKMQAELMKKALSKSSTAPTSAEITALAALGVDKDDAPKCRRYFTNDTTFEMLGEILRDSPRGLLVLHDELTGLLEGFERPGREGERQFYLTAWNGQSSHHVDRIGRGELYIPRLAAAVYGGIQPEKLEQYLYQTQMAGGNDGFIQRFQLAVYPDEIPTFRVVDELPDDAALTRVKKVAQTLADLDFTTVGAELEREGKAPFFRFEQRAQALFNKFLAALDRKARTQEAPLMAQHLSKFKKLVPALALIFHLVDAADLAGPKTKRRVSIGSLKRALLWADYLEAHANRMYAMGGDIRVQTAQALAKKIQQGAIADGFTERDVYKNDWAGLRDPEEVKGACIELEQAGWIRRIANETKRVGRLSIKYEINPAVSAGANATPIPTKPTKRPRREL